MSKRYWKFKEPVEGEEWGEGDKVKLNLGITHSFIVNRDLLEEAPAPIPEEPADRTIVIDRARDAWQRYEDYGDVWHCAHPDGRPSSWKDLQVEGPLIPMIREPTLNELSSWVDNLNFLETLDVAKSLLTFLKRLQ